MYTIIDKVVLAVAFNFKALKLSILMKYLLIN